jgi:hypothetical protein
VRLSSHPQYSPEVRVQAKYVGIRKIIEKHTPIPSPTRLPIMENGDKSIFPIRKVSSRNMPIPKKINSAYKDKLNILFNESVLDGIVAV